MTYAASLWRHPYLLPSPRAIVGIYFLIFYENKHFYLFILRLRLCQPFPRTYITFRIGSSRQRVCVVYTGQHATASSAYTQHGRSSASRTLYYVHYFPVVNTFKTIISSTASADHLPIIRDALFPDQSFQKSATFRHVDFPIRHCAVFVKTETLSRNV